MNSLWVFVMSRLPTVYELTRQAAAALRRGVDRLTFTNWQADRRTDGRLRSRLMDECSVPGGMLKPLAHHSQFRTRVRQLRAEICAG